MIRLCVVRIKSEGTNGKERKGRNEAELKTKTSEVVNKCGRFFSRLKCFMGSNFFSK